MKFTTVFWFSLLVHIPTIQAQIIPKGIGQQVGKISQHVTERTILNVENKLPKSLTDIPFSLSELPPIANLVTEPLNLLPSTLNIGLDPERPQLVEVEVEQGWRAIKNQWLVLADQYSKDALIKLGATIESSTIYDGLGLTLLHFTVPDAYDAKHQIAAHLSADSRTTLDRNHVYQAQTKATNGQDHHANSQVDAMCAEPLKIGMIDSAINRQHRVFEHANITSKSFLVDGLTSPNQHGTAVASIIVGEADDLKPLLPEANLYAAEVFYRQSDYSQGATLQAIIEALNWLVEQNVQVINMSLAGPDNRILQRVVDAALNSGAYIVAAAGNEGPAAAAMYPAGYPAVVAVSAIDSQNNPYRWSNRGDYIDYAALGVHVLTAQSQQTLGKESGTSMAAPVVSSALACELATQKGKVDRAVVLGSLSQRAKDMGPKGRDPVYGDGAISRN